MNYQNHNDSHVFLPLYLDNLPHPPALPPSALCPPNRPKISVASGLTPNDHFMRTAAAAAESGSPLRLPLGAGGLPQPGLGLDLAGMDPMSLQRRLTEQRMSMAALAAAAGQQQQQNVYELAALTQDMDTLQLTTRIRELLSSNNICQKVRK